MIYGRIYTMFIGAQGACPGPDVNVNSSRNLRYSPGRRQFGDNGSLTKFLLKIVLTSQILLPVCHYFFMYKVSVAFTVFINISQNMLFNMRFLFITKFFLHRIKSRDGFVNKTVEKARPGNNIDRCKFQQFRVI